MSQQVNRRTVAKGVAWAVPAVAFAGAVPAFAASGEPPTLRFLGACKYPGNNCGGTVVKAYGFAFEVTNHDLLHDIYFCSAVLTNISEPDLAADPPLWTKPPSGCVKVPKGGVGTLNFFFTNDNSANQNFTANMILGWAHTCPCSNDPWSHPNLNIPVTVLSTPPHGECTCDADFIPKP